MIRENPPVILIIDDEVLIRESFRDYLTDCGYGVLEAENGKTGVAIFKIEKPDLVLVDLRMPEMDGLEVLMHLQRISPETPVIVISGTGVITDAVDALRKGAWDFLSKPLPELSVLRHTVEKSLERARLISEKINQHKALVMANEELKKAKDLADVATQVKSDFLTNISHEIRTPLNGVVAAADLAIQEENVPPKILHLLEIIRSSARTLNGIINDILDFSRIESGSLTMEAQHFFLDDLIDSVVALGIQKIAEKKIELLVDIDPETPTGLIGDPHRIQQILNHLLDNASKFTDKAGVITMGVSPVESIFGKEEVLLRFFVKDTGIGMTADQMERLFQPFTQADTTTTRKHGGTGLGLSLCKKLIVLMGGDIWAESIPGKGSIFFFTLRLKKKGSMGVRN